MDSNGIKYENLDVAESKEARDEMIKKSGQKSVPVIDINGEILLGFNEVQLKEKLDI